MSISFQKKYLHAAEADAYMTAYGTKYVNAPVGKGSVYLDQLIHYPSEGVDDRVQTVQFPIPFVALELKELRGRRRFSKGSTKYITVRKTPFQAGQHEHYKKIIDPNWTGFTTAPERLRKLVDSHPTKQGIVVFNTGETIPYFKGTNFLSASVPSNPFKKGGTDTYKVFWNATVLNHANVEAMIADMINRRDLEGDPMAMGQLTLFASSALTPAAMSVAEDDFINDTQISNPIKKWKLKVETWQHLLPTRWGILNTADLEDYLPLNALKGEEDFNTWGRDSPMFFESFHMGYDIVVDFGIAPGRNEKISVASTIDVS